MYISLRWWRVALSHDKLGGPSVLAKEVWYRTLNSAAVRSLCMHCRCEASNSARPLLRPAVGKVAH